MDVNKGLVGNHFQPPYSGLGIYSYRLLRVSWKIKDTNDDAMKRELGEKELITIFLTLASVIGLSLSAVAR